ncbi:MAG: hypothetical protein ACFB4J_18315 [Elainellaceae cyanobacterium]
MVEPLYARPFPASQNAVDDSDLEAAWVAVQFHQEVKTRQAFEDYCQRYYQLAERHRQEFEQMSRDINVLGWFYRE